MRLLREVLFETRGPDINRDVTPIPEVPEYVKAATARNKRAAIALEAAIEEFLNENAKLRGVN